MITTPVTQVGWTVRTIHTYPTSLRTDPTSRWRPRLGSNTGAFSRYAVYSHLLATVLIGVGSEDIVIASVLFVFWALTNVFMLRILSFKIIRMSIECSGMVVTVTCGI